MPHARALAVVAAVAAIGVAGCGGHRQDADEPEGTFHIAVTQASFPTRQEISQHSTMRIEVRNTGKHTLPNVAVTVRTRPPKGSGAAPIAFGEADTTDTRLADNEKPVWIVDQGPTGGDTSYTNTWALGQMYPGQTKTFEWRLLPVKAGDYTVSYRVSPGLDGKAKPASADRTSGSFHVSISAEPVPAHVDGDGNVVRGEVAGAG
jgi:hypothetical protein